MSAMSKDHDMILHSAKNLMIRMQPGTISSTEDRDFFFPLNLFAGLAALPSITDAESCHFRICNPFANLCQIWMPL